MTGLSHSSFVKVEFTIQDQLNLAMKALVDANPHLDVNSKPFKNLTVEVIDQFLQQAASEEDLLALFECILEKPSEWFRHIESQRYSLWFRSAITETSTIIISKFLSQILIALCRNLDREHHEYHQTMVTKIIAKCKSSADPSCVEAILFFNQIYRLILSELTHPKFLFAFRFTQHPVFSQVPFIDALDRIPILCEDNAVAITPSNELRFMLVCTLNEKLRTFGKDNLQLLATQITPFIQEIIRKITEVDVYKDFVQQLYKPQFNFIHKPNDLTWHEIESALVKKAQQLKLNYFDLNEKYQRSAQPSIHYP